MTTIFGLREVHESGIEICDEKNLIFSISMILRRLSIWTPVEEGGMGTELNRLFCFASSQARSRSVRFVAETC